MKIVAIGLSYNEADIIGECVRSALGWADHYVLLDDSTDGTDDVARAAGAKVWKGRGEGFSEALRQRTVDTAMAYDPDWLVRCDPDEIYHGDPPIREVLEEALADDALCVRAVVLEFWLTLDDVRRGALLEDSHVSIQFRRRWYTSGHAAMVAWRPRPDLRFREGQMQNVPLDSEGQDVSQVGKVHGRCLVQRHYPCRDLHQLCHRISERPKLQHFGKYRHNLVIDETIGLHYLGADDEIDFTDNHHLVYGWYTEADHLFRRRRAEFGAFF